MSIKFSLFLAFFLILGKLSILAQPPGRSEGGPPANGSVSGVVFDPEDGRPLEYATVALISLRDSSVAGGTLTSADGRFTIDQLKFGRYRIKIDFIGYKAFQKDDIILKLGSSAVDIGRVDLASGEAPQTETVTVEGEKELMQIGPEKKTFNVEKSIVSQGGTAADVLQQVPSITIDQDGKASLRGAGNVTILIDGKPSMMAGGERSTVLDQIPANLIEKVEVITNPSARYDADGQAGIINIVLKKNRKPGYFGSVNANVGTRNKANTGMNLSYGNGLFNVTGAYSFRYTEMFRRSTDTRQNFPSDTFFITDQNGAGKNYNRSHTASIAGEYRPSDYDRFSANFDFNYRNNPRTDTISYRYSNENRVQTDDASRSSGQIETGLGFDGGLSYERRFKTPDRRFYVSANYSANNAEQTMTATQFGRLISQSSNRFRQLTPTKSSVGFLQIDYLHPLKNKARWEAGMKTYMRKIDNDFRADNYDYVSQEWKIDDKRSNHFVYNEQIYAIYGIYAGEWKKFTYQAGLRLEQANTRSEQLTQSATYKFNYFSYFPSLHVTYKLTDFQQISANMSRRINRPESSVLNPFYNYSDPLNLETGNPYLRPEYTNAFELGYNRFAEKWTFSSTVFYRYTTNQMIRYRNVQTDGVAILSRQNLGENHSYGVEAIVTNKWTKWWNTNLSGNANGLTMSDAALVTNGSRKGINVNVKLTSNFSINKRVDIQLAYNYRSPMQVALGRMREVQAVDVGVKVTVLKGKGAITLNVSDIFDMRRFAIDISGPTFIENAYWKRESRIGFLGFSYNFGNMKQQGQPNKRRERGEEGVDGGM